MSEHIPRAESENLDSTQQGYTGPTPPQGHLPPRGERVWVDRPEQLRVAVNVLKQSPLVAVDAEFTQVRSHAQNNAQSSTPRLALLQLAIPTANAANASSPAQAVGKEGLAIPTANAANASSPAQAVGKEGLVVDYTCFVVDALRLNDLSPLEAVVGSPNSIVLLHGAGADIRVMAARGLEVAHYCDLEATSRAIFGQHESSLAAMLQRAFGIRLDKSLQRTDWTRRPLPPAMIAYAARDAEVTLALYYWLDQHYHDILKLYENTDEPDPVAPWIEPFLQGAAPLSAEMAVAEAKKQGLILHKAQVAANCRDALKALVHPMRRSRLLRLIADLSLVQLVADIVPLLHAATSDERAASARALGRLGVKSVKDAIQPLLQDPVSDVRKAAQVALRNLSEKEPRQQSATPTKSVDGTRTWTVGAADQSDNIPNEEDSWKARLRSMMEP